ncbi:MAG: SH3 domain-containing protein [Anaerolineales bacterium]
MDYDNNLTAPAPSVSAERIASVPWGTVVDVLGRNEAGTWLEIRTPDGTVGWSYRPYYDVITGEAGNIPVTGG